MPKQISHFFKVGVTFVLAAVLTVFAAIRVFALLNREVHITAIFANARGIAPGSTITMSGVVIGDVDSVGLTDDNRAKMSLGIHKDSHVPLGSLFTIKAGLLTSSAELIVVPTKNPSFIPDGALVYGKSADPISDALTQSKELIGKTEALMTKFGNTADTLNKLLGNQKIQSNLLQTSQNLRDTTASLPALESDLRRSLLAVSGGTSQLIISLNSTRGNADKVITSADRLTESLNSTLTENRGTLKALLRDADDAAASVAALTDEVKSTVGDKDIHKSLVGTTQNLQSVSARLDSTASDIQRLADDPRLNSDVRETVTNLRATSESVRDLAGRLQGIRLPGEHRHSEPGDAPPAASPPFSATSLLEPGLVFDSLYDTKVERLRFDADYTLLTGHSGAFYRAGLYDATYGNHLNLEAGQGLFGNRLDYRYGLIAGTLGIGFDARTGPFDLRLDAFNPNRGTVDVRAKFNLNEHSAVTAGMDSLGAGNRATVGIQIRR